MLGSTLRQGQFANRFCLIHKTGRRLYPYAKIPKGASQACFVVAKPGADNNKAAMQIHVFDETKLEQLVLEQGYSVRCKPHDGGPDGLYNIRGYNIRGVERFNSRALA